MKMWLNDPYHPGKRVLYEFEDAPYTEDRVDAFAELFARGDTGTTRSSIYDPRYRLIGEIYAQKEANGLITYEDLEDELFPDPNRERERRYIRLREIPPIGQDLTQSRCERPAGVGCQGVGSLHKDENTNTNRNTNENKHTNRNRPSRGQNKNRPSSGRNKKMSLTGQENG